jgi:L-fucose isomerase-like protein
MFLPLGTYSPPVKLALISASRNCFPRSLSEERTNRILDLSRQAGIDLFVPQGACRIIETKDHALEAARQVKQAGCDAVVYFLGNFSPEIEDAYFIKQLDEPVMVIAAAEESGASLLEKRGDALCGLLSAALAISKRGLANRVHLPELPVVSAEEAVKEIEHFIKVAKVVKGARNATVGLFGPRPRDFETCNYNIASVNSIGIEVEELGLFDLQNEIRRIREKREDTTAIQADMKKEVPSIPDQEFGSRLSIYEQAIRNFRDQLKLSGAATQCCGNASTKLLKNPEMKFQVIMKRMMEPNSPPDITRGTIEGQFNASPITVVQVHGLGDQLQAHLMEGFFLDLDPRTFGCTGTAYLPGFSRFYRHILLGRFHHHAAVAFAHCGAVLYDAFKLLGVAQVFTPLPDMLPYPGENVFRNGLLSARN